jgi:hypothetical protein
MEITKHNICETIDNYLKEQKVRYEITDQDSKGCIYELFVSSTSGFIQVEYNLDNEEDSYIVLQLFTSVTNSGTSIYHSEWDNECTGCDSVEGEIDNLIESAKRVNQGISKVSVKIDQIKDICEEYGLDFDQLITLNYDFDL